MGKVIELYICSKCGVTNETENRWGPICKETGELVCANCCWKCEHLRKWGGISKCMFQTPEERRAASVKKNAAKVQQEIQRTSNIYHHCRKEKARLQAIKDAKRRAKWRKEHEQDRNMRLL